MKVKGKGRFGSIHRLAGLVPHFPPQVVLGIGDRAIGRTPAGSQIASTGALAHNATVRAQATLRHEIGRKTTPVNFIDAATRAVSPSGSRLDRCGSAAANR